MLKESVYFKLFRNSCHIDSEINELAGIAPEGAEISALPLSISDFYSIRTVAGSSIDYAFCCDDLVYI